MPRATATPQAAEREARGEGWKRLLDRMLVRFAGAGICTPAEGYPNWGHLMPTIDSACDEIKRLRAALQRETDYGINLCSELQAMIGRCGEAETEADTIRRHIRDAAEVLSLIAGPLWGDATLAGHPLDGTLTVDVPVELLWRARTICARAEAAELRSPGGGLT